MRAASGSIVSSKPATEKPKRPPASGTVSLRPATPADLEALRRWDKDPDVRGSLIDADWQILSRGAAGIKAALNLLGFEAGAPRSPSAPCDKAAVDQIRQALQAAELLA